jgi:uncharacterized protein YbjT (DUF2867 family)
MEVVVIGGTGTIGALIVAELSARGDSVRILSRRPPREVSERVSHRRVDLTTGQGLAEGLAGADTVVDASNDARRAKDILVDGTRRMLAAEQETGVIHHVAISIVGCDRVPLGYYRAKVAQEQAIAEAPAPWSLLRATQFHQLIGMAFEAAERFGVAPAGKARFQPIDPAIVAKRVADAVHDAPGSRLPDVAGPEVRTLGELGRAWREHSARRLVPVRLPMFGPIGKPLREGALCAPAAAAGGQTFEQWLAGR